MVVRGVGAVVTNDWCINAEIDTLPYIFKAENSTPHKQDWLYIWSVYLDICQKNNLKFCLVLFFKLYVLWNILYQKIIFQEIFFFINKKNSG